MLGGLLANFAAPLAFILAVSFIMKLWYNPREAQQLLTGLALVAAMPICRRLSAGAHRTDRPARNGFADVRSWNE